ncbi:MAG: hypothetical protein LBB46_02535, partial [Coriobacteriaceae bacterium]|nr:hypothetical protein [Coriobacteriaceae bacterium]
LRKQMFLFPKFLALGVAAIELPALWVKAFLLPEGDWWTVLCVAMLALVLGAFSLNCLWLVRHWLNKRIARKAPDYLSRERLTLHQRTDRVTPA